MRSPSATSSAPTVHMTTMFVFPTSDMVVPPLRHGGAPASLTGRPTVPPTRSRVQPARPSERSAGGVIALPLRGTQRRASGAAGPLLAGERSSAVAPTVDAHGRVE